MFKKILKWVGITALILLLGQITVGKNTLAGHFAQLTQNTLQWGAAEFRKTSLYTAMSRWPMVGKWLESESPKVNVPKVAMKLVPLPEEHKGRVVAPVPAAISKISERERISQSDRESLMRLLQ